MTPAWSIAEMAKTLSFSSTNPKMGGATPVKGYAKGGMVDTRNGGSEGIVYAEYDTNMEAEAKAPTVGYGEAPKVTAMTTIEKPGELTYYGESQKAAATELNQKRWDAYNRRVSNEAIRTGNVMPDAAKPTEVMQKIDNVFGTQAAQKVTKQAEAGTSAGLTPATQSNYTMGKVVSQSGITRSAPSVEMEPRKKRKDD